MSLLRDVANNIMTEVKVEENVQKGLKQTRGLPDESRKCACVTSRGSDSKENRHGRAET